MSETYDKGFARLELGLPDKFARKEDNEIWRDVRANPAIAWQVVVALCGMGYWVNFTNDLILQNCWLSQGKSIWRGEGKTPADALYAAVEKIGEE
jgi:hypothetical protein